MWSPKNESSLTQNNVLRFLLLEIICIILMVMDHSAKIATPIRAAISTLTYPLVKVIELPQNAYEFLSSSASNQFQLLSENVSLKQKLSQAQIELLQLEVISQQNQELRQLLGAKLQLPLKTTVAFLININTGDNAHHFIINQGFNQGVTIGQTVLDLKGVAGQIFSVDLETAHVILITNANHAVPVEFLRTGIRTFMYGTGDLTTLSLPEIPQSANVKVGDILITSGFGGVFPRGLKIATISTIIDSEDRSYRQAEAHPSADLNNIKQVLLVWSKEKTEVGENKVPVNNDTIHDNQKVSQ
ncbi:Rod shape-determining protein MreC [hydrothermal vent metagenome]|uniref:Cell shape-determining protein MreC n=1 Tax=hydrothermal vent metagenome TaxID=652676 RepID=A0A3B0V747_9ZZZZ